MTIATQWPAQKQEHSKDREETRNCHSPKCDDTYDPRSCLKGWVQLSFGSIDLSSPFDDIGYLASQARNIRSFKKSRRRTRPREGHSKYENDSLKVDSGNFNDQEFASPHEHSGGTKSRRHCLDRMLSTTNMASSRKNPKDRPSVRSDRFKHPTGIKSLKAFEDTISNDRSSTLATSRDTGSGIKKVPSKGTLPSLFASPKGRKKPKFKSTDKRLVPSFPKLFSNGGQKKKSPPNGDSQQLDNVRLQKETERLRKLVADLYRELEQSKRRQAWLSIGELASATTEMCKARGKSELDQIKMNQLQSEIDACEELLDKKERSCCILESVRLLNEQRISALETLCLQHGIDPSGKKTEKHESRTFTKSCQNATLSMDDLMNSVGALNLVDDDELGIPVKDVDETSLHEVSEHRSSSICTVDTSALTESSATLSSESKGHDESDLDGSFAGTTKSDENPVVLANTPNNKEESMVSVELRATHHSPDDCTISSKSLNQERSRDSSLRNGNHHSLVHSSFHTPGTRRRNSLVSSTSNHSFVRPSPFHTPRTYRKKCSTHSIVRSSPNHTPRTHASPAASRYMRTSYSRRRGSRTLNDAMNDRKVISDSLEKALEGRGFSSTMDMSSSISHHQSPP